MVDFNGIGNIVYTKYVISTVLYLYRTDDVFKKSVDEILNQPHKVTVNGETFADNIFFLEMACGDLATQIVKAYSELIDCE